MRENDRKFFLPLWRRIAVTIFCTVWAGWEWSNGENLWAAMTGGLAAYCVWMFFINFDASDPDKKAE